MLCNVILFYFLKLFLQVWKSLLAFIMVDDKAKHVHNLLNHRSDILSELHANCPSKGIGRRLVTSSAIIQVAVI
jgi:hypothetical protein